MTDKPDSDVFDADEQRLLALARQATEPVPEEVAERLAAMRREAVSIAAERLEHRRQNRLATSLKEFLAGFFTPGPRLALAGAAFAVVIAVTVLLRPAEQDLALPVVAEPEVALVEDLELLEELEFLAWLEEEEAASGAG